MIRAAERTDLAAIAACQIASWQDVYQGMLADDFLTQRVPQLLTDRWANWPEGDWRVDTAWLGGDLVGFVSLDMGHSGGPYVDNLHVLPRAKRHGFGARLMGHAAQHCLAAGEETLWLTVMAANTGARQFYAALGGDEAAAGTESLYGEPVTTHVLRWQGATLQGLALRGHRVGTGGALGARAETAREG